MYRKTVWYGTALATDIKEIFQIVLENKNRTDSKTKFTIIQSNNAIQTT